ncbi:unnamed protein product [Didymodactylos carnosus]|uniref:Uncharacterized protein n=1 Tax=Didymodactylos carnosus TaxID=1234261 RepID=A0A8S2FR70_9BILA|nr:unnamed protein product [Didymodactylos carnosus]CAF4324934.1 unnamed protein product [Didymodactylos carnosus]
MVDSTIEVCAREKRASDAVVQAVKHGLARQKQVAMEQQTDNNSLKPAFVEIGPDWTVEGEKLDCGFSSASMRDPQGRRVLIKTQDCK